MSNVTNIIFKTPPDSLTEDVFNFTSRYDLKGTTDQAGGNKSMECNIYMSAMNCIDRDKLLFDFYTLIIPLDPEDMRHYQLLIQEQDDYIFKSYDIYDKLE